jgi:enoyl-CoA hydratase/carnithine racemase
MDTSGFQHLKVSTEQDGHLVVVELDHGRANEMGRDLVAEWARLVDALEAGPARALLTFSRRFSRRGTPIFISGANVTERGDWTPDEVRAHVTWQRATLARLRRAPVFHVAVVDGVALGWGTEFLMTCDYRIAGPGASLALPETGLGIIPGAGGTGELWALIGVPQALRLGMTGERIDADEALRIGLVQETADSMDSGLARARSLCEAVARRSPTAVAAFKRGVLAAVGRDAATRTDIEARAYELCVESGEAARGRAAFKALLAGGAADWGPRSTYEP